MISYDNRAYLQIVFRWTGSLIWSKLVILPTLLSCVICIVGFHYPSYLDLDQQLVWPAWVYTTILSFVIVFRTSLAYNRFFEGATASVKMMSLWRSAFASLLGFLDASIEEHRYRGNDRIIEELVHSKGRFLHWFSLLFAVAVQTLQWREEPDDLRPVRADEMKQEARRSFWSQITEEDICERIYIHSTPTQQEMDQMSSSFDKLTVIIQWIQCEASRLHCLNRIYIHSSIITRIYEELSSGMLAYCEAHMISVIPFPFLFAQVLSYALYSFSILCPFIVYSALREQEGGLTQEIYSWPALISMNVLLVGGFAGLNEIAIELEDPFTEKLNNFPLRVFQQRVDASLVDIAQIGLPSDFKPEYFGDSVVKASAAAENYAMCKALDPEKRKSPASATEAVAKIVEACEDLRLWVVHCVQDIQEDNVLLAEKVGILEQQMSEAAYRLFLSRGGLPSESKGVCQTYSDTEEEKDNAQGVTQSTMASSNDGDVEQPVWKAGEDRLRKLLKESGRINYEMSPLLIREVLFEKRLAHAT
mmetsp:Transcript_34148/g.72634  ORF Transcript_34148/g.72634 Transcript_34148/m.72634 type:complete len:532 (+) Transcript_34148:164-1759(+)